MKVFSRAAHVGFTCARESGIESLAHDGEELMAVSAPRARPFSPGQLPRRLLLLGLAAAVAVAGSYVAIAGNPLTRNQQTVSYQTSAVNQGTVQVTVSAAGPVTAPASLPLSFPNAGKLSQV